MREEQKRRRRQTNPRSSCCVIRRQRPLSDIDIGGGALRHSYMLSNRNRVSFWNFLPFPLFYETKLRGIFFEIICSASGPLKFNAWGGAIRHHLLVQRPSTKEKWTRSVPGWTPDRNKSSSAWKVCVVPGGTRGTALDRHSEIIYYYGDKMCSRGNAQQRVIGSQSLADFAREATEKSVRHLASLLRVPERPWVRKLKKFLS